MSDSFSTEAAEFDRYADGYDAALRRGLAVSGEEKEHSVEGESNGLRPVWRACNSNRRTSWTLDAARAQLHRFFSAWRVLHPSWALTCRPDRLSARRATTEARAHAFCPSLITNLPVPRFGILQWSFPPHLPGRPRGRGSIHLSIAPAWRAVRLVGKQSLEPRRPVRHEQDSFRPRCDHAGAKRSARLGAGEWIQYFTNRLHVHFSPCAAGASRAGAARRTPASRRAVSDPLPQTLNSNVVRFRRQRLAGEMRDL